MQTNVSPDELQRILSEVSTPGAQRAAAKERERQVLMVGARKDVVLSVVLCFFFGPLGLLYSSPVGAIVACCATLVMCWMTLGIGTIVILPFAWILSMLFAWYAASAHNDRLERLLRDAG